MITVKNRTLIMSKDDKVVGSLGDNGVSTRTFAIPRYDSNESDKASLTYIINTKYPSNNTENTIYPKKTYDENNIYLTWDIQSNDIPYSGNMFIQIKAYEVSGTFVWYTFKDYLVIGDSLGASQTYSGSLSALETLIASCEGTIEDAEEVVTEAGTAKETFDTLVADLNTTKADIDSKQKQVTEQLVDVRAVVNDATNKLANCVEATSNATAATTQLNTALSNAETVTSNATEAASSATSASSSATSAANIANTAATRANTAAEACEGIVLGTGTVPLNSKGQANGVASLDNNGKVPLTQLPEITSSNIVSVKDNGAVGDSTTDDTTAFKTAISKCTTQGGILYIEEGTYLITEKLFCTKTINIMGAGAKLSILKYRPTVTTEGHKFHSTNYTGSNACLIIEGDNSTLSNFAIDGGTSGNVNSGSGIIMHYVKRFQNHAGYVYKNKVKLTFEPEEVAGIDYNLTYDAKIEVDGTATASGNIEIGEAEMTAGTYTMTGCPVGGSQSTYCLKIVVGSSTYYDTGSGVTFTVASNTTASIYFMYANGATYDFTLQPMVRLSTENDTFVTGWYIGYEAAQRVLIEQVNGSYLKNGIDITGGWNREIRMCNFSNCSNAGIQFLSREEDRLGQYCSSGDLVTACQFVANTYGIYAKNTYQTKATNCIFEYNNNAINSYNNQDIVFEQCWNEANTGKILVTGNAKFNGGFNISYSEVNHTLLAAKDLCSFENSTESVKSREGIIVFHQVGGVITQGVEIGTEIQNLIVNPYWKRVSGATTYEDSYEGWECYPNTSIVYIDNANKYNDYNSVTVSLSGRTSEQYFQIMQSSNINIDRTHTFTFSCKLKTPDRSAIDGNGVTIFISYKDASGNTVTNDNRNYTMLADNVWETFEYNMTIPSGVSSVKIGLGLEKNGTVHFAIPTLIDNSNYGSSDVYIKQDKTDTNLVNMYQADGTLIRTLDTTFVNTNNAFATCSTAAATAAKTADLTGYMLDTGSIVRVKFTNANTASSPTLNINSTGAKAIHKKGSAVGSGAWTSGQTIELVYDGTQWNICESGNYAENSHTHSSYATKASPTFSGTPNVEASTTYTTAMFRNNVLVSTDPGTGTETTYVNGTIISVYE